MKEEKVVFIGTSGCLGVPNATSTAYINQWSEPKRVQVIENKDNIEFVYKQRKMITMGYSLPETRVYKIIFSCVNGEWHKSDPIFGTIIPANEESYEF